MRVSLPLLVALALAGHAAPCLAQTTPDKAASPQPKHATDASADRVDALSPDEARRAARARARAAAKEQPTGPAAVADKRPPAPAAAKAEATIPAPKQAPAPTRAAAERGSGPETRAASAKTKTIPPKSAATATMPESRPDRVDRDQAEQAAPSRPVRHAAHAPRIAPSRETAEDELRHVRRRPYATAARGPSGETAAPRVGDVVPPGVPLYPLPPRGYGPRPLPPPGYGPPSAAARGMPPFPRSRDDEADDDDGPPPRHGFMAPY